MTRLASAIRFGLAASFCVISEAGAEPLGGGADFEPPVMRLILGFALCAMIALLAALALRRFMRAGFKLPTRLSTPWPAAAARTVRVHETHRIGAQGEVCRLSWGEREFLVVVAGNAVAVIDTRDAPPPATSP